MTENHDKIRQWLRANVRVSLGMTTADATVSIKKTNILALDDPDAEEGTYRQLLGLAFDAATTVLIEKLDCTDETLEFDPENVRARLQNDNNVGFQAGGKK